MRTHLTRCRPQAEVDIDGTVLAARLHERYIPEILASQDLRSDLPVLLSWYAEDVTRMVEDEVAKVEKVIRWVRASVHGCACLTHARAATGRSTLKQCTSSWSRSAT